MNEVKMLREHIRNLISNVRKEQKQEYKNKIKEERTLRRFVRSLIKEAEDTSPSFSTGINVLKDLLATIVPILADEYKNLTTDPEQRKSFRSHTVKAIQNLLAPESMLRKAADQAKAASAAAPAVPAQPAVAPPVEGEEESLTEQEDLEAGQQPTDPRFVDVCQIATPFCRTERVSRRTRGQRHRRRGWKGRPLSHTLLVIVSLYFENCGFIMNR
jgi:hypothetical protein